jgi:ABC-2 type transport system ATP-binding protein
VSHARLRPPQAPGPGQGQGGAAPAPAEPRVVFDDVSKFYGEVLGVNRVSITLSAGITSLVGPNGAGKTTLLNLMTGLLQPTRGRVSVLGVPADRAEALGRLVGYCTQYDAYPGEMSGRSFVEAFLGLGGYPQRQAQVMAAEAIELVGMQDAADRRIAAYSKGMRQRIKLAQAIAHRPPVLVLDEPLNGLDPMARADVMALFRAQAAEGRHVIISSHILHEVELLSDRVVLLSGGYVVAEGNIREVRGEMGVQHPLQVMVRCADPGKAAAALIGADHVVSVQVHADRRGFLLGTTDVDALYRELAHLVTTGAIDLETVVPADEDVQSVYRYLIGPDGAAP